MGHPTEQSKRHADRLRDKLSVWPESRVPGRAWLGGGGEDGAEPEGPCALLGWESEVGL